MRDRPDRPRQRGRTRPGVGASSPARRPVARRPATGPGTATTRVSAGDASGRFTTRIVVLAVVLVALALSYVFPLRVYLAQQAEIAELRAAQTQQRAHIAELEETAALWADEDYIRIQARMRLYFGEPGEQLLLVTPPGRELEPPATGFDPDAVPPPRHAWWDTLWASVRTADAAGVEPAGGEQAAGEQAAGEEAGD